MVCFISRICYIFLWDLWCKKKKETHLKHMKWSPTPSDSLSCFKENKIKGLAKMYTRSGQSNLISLRARSPPQTSWPPLILTHFTVCFFFQGKNSHWIPSDLSGSHYDVWCYPNQMSWGFSTAWERSGQKQPCMFKTCLPRPKPGPDHSLLSPQVCFGWTNGFRQNNSQRMICPL